MRNYLIRTLATLVVFFVEVTSSYAGFLQFPVLGYTSFNVPVTAVMDHDDRWNYIKTYTGETGSYYDGCLAYVNGQNVACDPNTNASAPWAYQRPGGASWSVPGLNYLDMAPGNNTYMWYDNHHGYDYAVPQYTAVVAAAGGTIVDINSTWGQMTIDHGNGYKTTYTHMYLLLPQPTTVLQGAQIGWVSNVAPIQVAVHLHFVVNRLINGVWTLVDPYGGDGQPVLWQ